MVRTTSYADWLGRFLYGALFVLIIPIFLIWWAIELEEIVPWPLPESPLTAAFLMVLGAVMMGLGMVGIIRHGEGLPMNAYPPKKLVTRGIYGVVAHPIYVGAVILTLGVALFYGSSSGVFVITPFVGLMALALVYGYERLAMARLFGLALDHYRPLLALPKVNDAAPNPGKKMALTLAIVLPWFLVGYLIDFGRCAGLCQGSLAGSLVSTETRPMDLLWLVPYLYVLARMGLSRSAGALRHYSLATLLAGGFGLFLNLMLPVELARTLVPLGLHGGLHLLAVVIGLNHVRILAWLQRWTESVANSRHDWLLFGGSFRVINHSIYSGVGGAIGFALASYIIGDHMATLAMVIFVLLGGAIVARLWWGNNQLLRPFGYWGGVAGGLVGALVVNVLFGVPIRSLLLGFALCAPWVQAVGRLRCLVQGCCHGIKSRQSPLTIQVYQPQSRVVAISGLSGQHILNTQLFSMVLNLLIGAALWRLWSAEFLGAWTIIGLYCLATGIERFVEDAYRGEVQTRMVGEMPENQFVAIGAIIVGLLFTLLSSPAPQVVAPTIDAAWLVACLVAGALAAFALSMDFPRATRSFSRLSG